MKRALITICLLALIVPSEIPARIVPDACIGRIGLWDSGAEVLRQLGKPIRKERRPPDTWWHYRTGSVLLTPWSTKSRTDLIVLAVSTRDRDERMPSGIGVGSSISEVRAAGFKWCDRSGSCDVGQRDNRSTTLRLRNGRVVEVSISLYSDYDDGSRRPPDRRCRSS